MRRLVITVVVFALAGMPAPDVTVVAERLPWTTYTTAQGLNATEVNAAIEDRHGFLWLGTDRGLARFDGLTFRHFGKEQGLTRRNITSLAFTRDGTLWVGTWGGVFQFDSAHGGTFIEVPFEGNKRQIERTRLLTGPDGQLWCVADVLYRLERGETARFQPATFANPVLLPWVTAFLPDRHGNLWIAYHDLLRVDQMGHVVHVRPLDGHHPGEITSIVEDTHGRIWVAGGSQGLWSVESSGERTSDLILKERLRGPGIGSMVARESGGVWIGLNGMLMEIAADGTVLRQITRNEGLVSTHTFPLLIDSAGDLWVSSAGGVQRLAAEGFASFGPADGLEAPLVRAIWRRRTGDLMVVSAPDLLQRFDGHRFVATRPAFPAGIRPGWGWFQVDTEDRDGRWWFPTATALVQFAPVKNVEVLSTARPSIVFGSAGCFPGGDVFRVYEDSVGDVWVATITRDQETIYRWSRTTGTFSCFRSESFLGSKVAPTAFLDDGLGSMWIGFYNGQLARYRHGQFTCVADCGGSRGLINALFLDARKRLWIATSRMGAFRVDDPAAESPRFVRVSTENGLASDRATAITEDRFGRIYIGTERGVDVFEDNRGRVRHLEVVEGLPQAYVSAAFADGDGRLWFGTLDGLARFTPPHRFRDIPPPHVLIDGIRISGVPQPVSSFGVAEVGELELGPDQRDVVIDYVGMPRTLASTTTFQYRLRDDDPWSAPSARRSVALAGLAAGRYVVEFRALDAAGHPSPHTALVSLRVLAPFYKRGWFITGAALASVLVASVAYRTRVRRLVDLERQRTRIAMDLHDEMGSRLGSIGLLADVARGDAVTSDKRRHFLEQIADTAAEMGSSLTDIVWSMRPGEATIDSLARHLAQRGRLLFPNNEPTLEIRPPAGVAGIETSLAVRRAVFLIGIEALHNASSHSGARHVVVTLRPVGRRWQLEVRDDGSGLAPADGDNGRTGFGLATMKRRADEIGATLTIDSVPNAGTTVRLLFDARADDSRFQSRMNIRDLWTRIRGIK